MSVCHLKRAESKSFCFQREVVFCLLFLGVNSTLRANLFPGLEGPLTFLFFFFFSSLPPAKYKEYIWVHFCVHSYIFVCVCAGWVISWEWKNLITSRQMCVCDIDLWLFGEHCSRPSERDINPLYQSDLPLRFCATLTQCIPFFRACLWVCVCVCRVQRLSQRTR